MDYLFSTLIGLSVIIVVILALIIWYGIYLLVRKYIFKEDTEKKEAIVVTTMFTIVLFSLIDNNPITKTSKIEADNKSKILYDKKSR